MKLKTAKILVIALIAIVALPSGLSAQRKLDKGPNELLSLVFQRSFMDFVKDSKLKEIAFKIDNDIQHRKSYDEKGRIVQILEKGKILTSFTYNDIDSTMIMCAVTLPSDTFTHQIITQVGNYSERMNLIDSTYQGKSMSQVYPGISIVSLFDAQNQLNGKVVQVKDEADNTIYKSELNRDGCTTEEIYETVDSIEFRTQNRYDALGGLTETTKRKMRIKTKNKTVVLNKKGKTMRITHFDDRGNQVKDEMHYRGEKSQIETSTYDSMGRLLTRRMEHLLRETVEVTELIYEGDELVPTEIRLSGESEGSLKYDKDKLVYMIEYSYYE